MGELIAVQGDYHSHCEALFGDPLQYCVKIDGNYVLTTTSLTVHNEAIIYGSSFMTIDGKNIALTRDPIQPHPPPIGGGNVVTGTQTFVRSDRR
jgi:uncharacterized Zn-binding protein involved in type VI secretion